MPTRPAFTAIASGAQREGRTARGARRGAAGARSPGGQRHPWRGGRREETPTDTLEEMALVGDGLRVDESMGLGKDFAAEGEVRLIGAHIGGQLSFDRVTLKQGLAAAACASRRACSARSPSPPRARSA
jgi:hypothetical protein